MIIWYDFNFITPEDDIKQKMTECMQGASADQIRNKRGSEIVWAGIKSKKVRGSEQEWGYEGERDEL